MVAITVILAAVIGTFVLGLGDDVEQDVQAGATVNQDTNNDRITITWSSQGTADGIAVVGVEDEEAALNVDSIGSSITLDSDTLSEDISQGDVVNIVAYRGGEADAETEPGEIGDDAERTTVIRSFEANFDVE